MTSVEDTLIKFDFIGLGPAADLSSLNLKVNQKTPYIPTEEDFKEIEDLLTEVRANIPKTKYPQGDIYTISTMKGGGDNSYQFAHQVDGVETILASFYGKDDIGKSIIRAINQEFPSKK